MTFKHFSLRNGVSILLGTVWKFSGYGRPGIKSYIIPVENKDIENFQDLEAQHHTHWILKLSMQENIYLDMYINYMII